MLIPLQDRALKNEARRQLETIKDTEHGNDSRPGSTGLEKDSSRLLKREAGYFHGYTYIFAETYGINSGLSNIIFVGLFIGVLLQLITVPFIVRKTNRQLERDGDAGQGTKLGRESSLLFAIYSAPFVPIGLFWMAWTDYASISVCSPILASVMVGAGIISIFLSAYMYIIDAYLAAGGMTVVSVPMYRNLGPHYALTILACISAAAVPIPWALIKWGTSVKKRASDRRFPIW
ncbi:hypothetical protein PMIN02_009440 [Paraphaeosphaeria minitans]